MTASTPQQSTLPTPVQQIATADQLGAFIKRYDYSARELRSSIGYGVGGLLVLGFAALMLGVLLEDDIAHHNIGAGDWLMAAFLLLLLGIILGCCRLIFHALALIISKPKIYQFKQGLVILRGNRASSYPWRQVKFLWKTVIDHYLKQSGTFTSTVTYQGRSYHFTLRLQDDRKLRLDNDLEHIRELGEQIDQEVFQALWPAALASLEAGETLSFGNFRIDAQGLIRGQKALSWKDWPLLTVNKGSVTIKAAGQEKAWAKSELAEIPNYRLFLALIGRQSNLYLNAKQPK
ncbi:hypothetical protein KSF_090640 [Reticulibacter mediterranei]|uniref:Uncharacterized protein n=1 Tax=Reticulibacter mediterranei TaxID=2778369 RepID=A0A8J3IZV0_9CHLR|nr:DUF6585 family protein [Reticulibacter mediterranei]GHO99016.1 hypothetical protein KSF_090640 [Reticulibacter mediterranei]